MNGYLATIVRFRAEARQPAVIARPGCRSCPSPLRLGLFPLLLLLALATPASAQDDPASRATPGLFPAGLDQTVYKGLVGHALDAIPMDPSQRVGLQRANAVVSGTYLGRSLTVLAGLTNPVLLIGGFIWGIWAASNITPPQTGMNLAAAAGPSGEAAAAQERLVQRPAPPAALDGKSANTGSEPILVSSISAREEAATIVSRPLVVKIWLPLRSSTPPH